MKLERNVKAKERRAIVKHVQYRTQVANKTSTQVRVRGHEINRNKYSRWIKEMLIGQPSSPISVPSRKFLL